MKKQIISFVLSLLLLIGLIPITAITTFAAEETNVEDVLKDTLTQLATTVTEPKFGTNGGEWTVIALARGEHFDIGDKYFEDYYGRIAETVPDKEEKAINAGKKAGALDKNKSTENSRLIMALSAIGKDPTDVGGVNVLGAYDANGFDWIEKQNINGPIFTLIALDTNNYQTTDTTLRQKCVDFILGKELTNGGWALSGTTADPDITSMALQALVNYKNQTNVEAAANRAFVVLSNMQKENGGFASWGTVNSESIAQVITALSAWGINANEDSRFVKNDNSAIDALLAFYDEECKAFKHVMTGAVNAMATDQAAYALVAYERFKKGKSSLYNMSDASKKEDTPEENIEKELIDAIDEVIDDNNETIKKTEQVHEKSTETPKSDNPATGDSNKIGLLIFLISGAALIIATVLFLYKKRNSTNKL